jgi:hypothetical protein
MTPLTPEEQREIFLDPEFKKWSDLQDEKDLEFQVKEDISSWAEYVYWED